MTRRTDETETDLVPVLVELSLGSGEGEYKEPKPFIDEYIKNKMTKSKCQIIFVYVSFGETIEFAESLGWVDNHGDSEEGDWSPTAADHCEGEALKYIRSKGYIIKKEVK